MEADIISKGRRLFNAYRDAVREAVKWAKSDEPGAGKQYKLALAAEREAYLKWAVWRDVDDHLEALFAQQEECAKLVDSIASDYYDVGEASAGNVATFIAGEIRAGGDGANNNDGRELGIIAALAMIEPSDLRLQPHRFVEAIIDMISTARAVIQAAP